MLGQVCTVASLTAPAGNPVVRDYAGHLVGYVLMAGGAPATVLFYDNRTEASGTVKHKNKVKAGETLTVSLLGKEERGLRFDVGIAISLAGTDAELSIMLG